MKMGMEKSVADNKLVWKERQANLVQSIVVGE